MFWYSLCPENGFFGVHSFYLSIPIYLFHGGNFHETNVTYKIKIEIEETNKTLEVRIILYLYVYTYMYVYEYINRNHTCNHVLKNSMISRT